MGKKDFSKKWCFSLDGAIKTRKITLAAPLKDDLKKGSDEYRKTLGSGDHEEVQKFLQKVVDSNQGKAYISQARQIRDSIPCMSKCRAADLWKLNRCTTYTNVDSLLKRNNNNQVIIFELDLTNWEFDPGSGWTLAVCLIHASRSGVAIRQRRTGE